MMSRLDLLLPKGSKGDRRALGEADRHKVKGEGDVKTGALP
jgi:hypothetical protein